MGLNVFPGDRQAEAATHDFSTLDAMAAGAAEEGIEYLFAFVRRDSRALVGDVEDGEAAFLVQANLDALAGRSELDGVGDQVVDDDAQLFRIAVEQHRRQIAAKLDATRRRCQAM